MRVNQVIAGIGLLILDSGGLDGRRSDLEGLIGSALRNSRKINLRKLFDLKDKYVAQWVQIRLIKFIKFLISDLLVTTPAVVSAFMVLKVPPQYSEAQLAAMAQDAAFFVGKITLDIE